MYFPWWLRVWHIMMIQHLELEIPESKEIILYTNKYLSAVYYRCFLSANICRVYIKHNPFFAAASAKLGNSHAKIVLGDMTVCEYFLSSLVGSSIVFIISLPWTFFLFSFVHMLCRKKWRTETWEGEFNPIRSSHKLLLLPLYHRNVMQLKTGEGGFFFFVPCSPIISPHLSKKRKRRRKMFFP